MKCKCNKCGSVFEATGLYFFKVLIGKKECPKCGGKVRLIQTRKKNKERGNDNAKN